MDKKTYNFSADIIRSLAILGVVIIHTTNAVYTRADFLGGSTWWIAIILDSLSRISIPLFLLLSGFFILKKNESLQDSLKRIFIRIGIPLIFWLYFYNWYGGGFVDWHRVNFSIFRQLFFVDVYHLYYLVIAIGLYFAAPFIRLFLSTANEKSQGFFMKFVLGLGMVEVALQFIFHACLSQNFFTMWIPFTGLFVAGLFLGKKAEKFSSTKLAIGYIVGLAATIGLNYLNFWLILHHNKIMSPAGCLSHYTDYYLSINVVLMSLCAFLLLLKYKFATLQKSTYIVKFINSLARASFGIYLIHPFINRFLEVQFHLAVDFSSLPLLFIIGLKLFIVFFGSYLISTIALRIPLVRYLFGGK